MKKVCVLYGGNSSEREVSLKSGEFIHKSLVKGTLLSSKYTPINLKLKTNSLPARSSKCNNCIIS